MSKRVCQECGKTYNSNDPGRMMVCFQCMPSTEYDMEQEEPVSDKGDCHPHNYTCDCEDCSHT
jgi:hypothetical protein